MPPRRTLDPAEPIYLLEGQRCITVSAAARAHGVTRQGARDACMRGALPYIKAPVGSIAGTVENIMVPIATLWEWTPRAKVKAPAAPRARASNNGGRPTAKKKGRRSSLTR